MSITPTTNYAGRQVDVELLQSIVDPAGEQQVHITNVGTSPKIVTGVQKALQRYVVLLMQQLGTVRFAPAAVGTTFLVELTQGRIGTKGALMQAFAFANSDALRQLAADNTNATLFGTLLDDESIKSVVLSDVEIDYPTGTVMLTLTFSFASGTDVVYVVPVTTVR